MTCFRRASLFSLLLFASACGDRDRPAPTASEMAALEARVMAADAADGKSDHVVEKCVTCGLGMQGKPSHAVQFAEDGSPLAGYTFHLCSEHCQATFAADPRTAVEALPTPQS